MIFLESSKGNMWFCCLVIPFIHEYSYKVYYECTKDIHRIFFTFCPITSWIFLYKFFYLSKN